MGRGDGQLLPSEMSSLMISVSHSSIPGMSGRARRDATRFRTGGSTPSLSRGEAADAVESPCCVLDYLAKVKV